jgi:hypothetical protein
VSNLEPLAHELRSERLTKFEPVQRKVIDLYPYILRILIDREKKGVNDIFRQLQKFKEQEPRLTHKPHITKAIRYLVKGKLIKEAQETASQRKKAGKIRLKDLTDLGHELSKLIIDVDEYKKSYSNLKSAIKEHFDISHGFGIQTLSKNQLRHRLRQKGWNTEDIKNYPSWLEEAFQLEHQASISIVDALMSRYSEIIFKCENNILAREILYRVVLDAIRECILSRLEGLFSERMYVESIENIRKITSYQLSDRTFTYLLNYTPPEQKISLSEMNLLKC